MNSENIKKEYNKCISQGKDGFTLTIDGKLYTPDRGYVVAWKTYDNLDDAISELSSQQSKFIGYWKDPLKNKEYIEVVDIYKSGFEALQTAIARGEKAIYNFANDTVIDLAGIYNTNGDDTCQ